MEIQGNKIRILQFTIAASKGGRTQYVLNNWKYIDKHRFQFDFVTFSKTLDYEQELVEEGCNVYHISCYPEENKEKFVEEFDQILEQGYDVIHIHTSYWKNTIVEERAKYKGIKKIIIHSHNTGCGTSITKEQEERECKRHCEIRNDLHPEMATDFWACSIEAAEWLYGNQISGDKIKIMKNAIDLKRFTYSCSKREAVRKKLGIENEIVIGHVGRFAYQKNHRFLIDVFEKIYKKNHKTRLYLVGRGELEEGIKQQVKQLGLSEVVLFMGWRADVNELLQAIDIFVLPSRFEGLPIVAVEAQASGCPCILSDTITKEVLITKNVKHIPLDKVIWQKEIESYIEGFERKKTDQEIIQAGFDINMQIHEIEKEYSSVEDNL